MRTCILVSILLPLSNLGLAEASGLGQGDLSTDGDTGPSFKYVPSNSNTRPPKLFSDPVIPDTSYHELVPALEVLEDLVTTTRSPANQV